VVHARARHWLVLTLVSLVASGGGCGGDATDEKDGSSAKDNGVASKPATQILSDAAAALERARSVHMEGTATLGGKRTALRIDLEQPRKIRVAFKDKDVEAALVAVGRSVYIKADAAFWRQQRVGRAAATLADKWLKVPGSAADLRDLTKGLDLATLSRCLRKEHGTIRVAGKATVNGRPAVVLVDKGDRPGTAPGKLFVATTGAPVPLRAITTGKQKPGGRPDPRCSDPDSPATPGDQVSFSRYNEALKITAPAGARDLTPDRGDVAPDSGIS